MMVGIVETWGKALAIRIPGEIANASGLTEGDVVRMDTLDGCIRIRRSGSSALVPEEAQAAAAEIIADSRKYSLRGQSIRELRDWGRRG